MRILTVLLVTSALGMSGCQYSADTEAPRQLPTKVPDPVVDLALYPVPHDLGPLRLSGHAQREGGPGRLSFYQGDDPAGSATVVVYPMPGGWDDLSPGRAVGGQYGVAREALLARLTRQGYGTIQGREESLLDTPFSRYPIAQVMLNSVAHPEKPARILLLGAVSPVFVRVEREGPAPEAGVLLEQTRQWLEQMFEAWSAAQDPAQHQRDGQQ